MEDARAGFADIDHGGLRTVAAEHADVVRLAASGGIEGRLVQDHAVRLRIRDRDHGREGSEVAIGLVKQRGAASIGHGQISNSCTRATATGARAPGSLAFS